MPHPYARAHRPSARYEAFSWYEGTPPSVDEARRHFASRAELDPAKRALYAEALEIFLATWSRIPPTA